MLEQSRTKSFKDATDMVEAKMSSQMGDLDKKLTSQIIVVKQKADLLTEATDKMGNTLAQTQKEIFDRAYASELYRFQSEVRDNYA